MNSSAAWSVVLSKRARRLVARAPRPDRERLQAALKAMEDDPFAGDVVRLKDQPTAFRRRVGDWRIFFDADPERRVIEIPHIERRTTSTYRRRH